MLLERLIEYEIKEYDSKLLNEQILKKIGNAIKSFFQKVFNFLTGIGKNTKLAHEIFIKDWGSAQKKFPEFFDVLSKKTKIKDFNDILENSDEAIINYIKNHDSLGSDLKKILLQVIKDDFKFFEHQWKQIEIASNQQTLNAIIVSMELYLEHFEGVAEDLSKESEEMGQNLKKFNIEKVLELLLELKQQGNLTEEVTLKALKYIEKYIEIQNVFPAFNKIAEALEKIFENFEVTLEKANEKYAELSGEDGEKKPDGNQKGNRTTTGPVSKEIDQVLSDVD